MTYQEILEKFNAGIPLYWEDPQPIPGNDYKISYIEHIQEESDAQDFVLIQYNQGGSEAEVFLSEIIDWDPNRWDLFISRMSDMHDRQNKNKEDGL